MKGLSRGFVGYITTPSHNWVTDNEKPHRTFSTTEREVEKLSAIREGYMTALKYRLGKLTKHVRKNSRNSTGFSNNVNRKV
jgi:hypothetical protein